MNLIPSYTDDTFIPVCAGPRGATTTVTLFVHRSGTVTVCRGNGELGARCFEQYGDEEHTITADDFARIIASHRVGAVSTTQFEDSDECAPLRRAFCAKAESYGSRSIY